MSHMFEVAAERLNGKRPFQPAFSQHKLDHWIAGSLVSGLCLIGVLPVSLIPYQLTPSSILALAMYGLLTLGLAFWLSDHILALFWSPSLVPLSAHGIGSDRIAVVMTVCDDARPEPLARFLELGKLGYDLYLLDDSDMPTTLPNTHRHGCRVVRRSSRKGAKGGNLNHWLRSHGNQYDFLCILDSDSNMPAETLHDLCRAASHEDNQDVAVFQSKLAEDPNHQATLQARLTAMGAYARMTISERVHARLGYFMSKGHNQLVRLCALRAIGGFSERFGAEDTALSLSLSSWGWRTVLVNSWSFDREPASFIAYSRRTVRWARQIVELFFDPWHAAPLFQKVLLARALLGYLAPFMGMALLMMSLWLGPSDFAYVARAMAAVWQMSPGHEALGRALWVGTTFSCLSIFLPFLIFRRSSEAASIRCFSLHWAHGCAMNVVLAIPLAVYMLTSALGKPVSFVPTNSQKGNLAPGFLLFVALMLIGGAVSVTALVLGARFHPGSLAMGLTGIWTALILSSMPLFLWVCIQSRREASRMPEET